MLRAPRLAAVALGLSLLGASPARALPPEADFRHVSDWAWFALGAATSYVSHELGHVVTDLVFGKTPQFVGTKLGPLPFFAIQPCCKLSHYEQYVIASAGFLVQDISSELILWLEPRLRSKRRAFLKGVLVFDIGLSLGYAVAAFANLGPPQGDVATMARGLGAPAWPIGLWLAVPAIIDVYRYLVPDSRWAPWVSLQGKTLTLGAGLTF